MPGELFAQGVRVHPALTVDGDERATAFVPSPEQPERAVDRDVPLAAGDDAERRRAGETVTLDVPAGAASTWCLAAASAVVFAPWAPVTKPLETPAGRPSRSAIHSAATASAAAAAGEATTEKPFWSHAVATQSAATAAGKRAPEDEPEVASGLRPDDAGLRRGDQLAEHRRVLPAFVGQRPTERGANVVERRLGSTGRVSSESWNCAA